MKKTTSAIIIAILIILVAGSTYYYFYKTQKADEANTKEQPSQQNKVVVPDVASEETKKLVEDYVRAHISELSPEPAVLGGTFYVLDIIFPTAKNCVVNYEDGHIALTAIANFKVSEAKEVTITSFELVETVK